MDLGVEDERPGPEEVLGVDDPARLLVDREFRRIGFAPVPKSVASNLARTPRAPSENPIGDDAGEMVDVAGVLLDEDVPVLVDPDVVDLVELRILRGRRLDSCSRTNL